MGEHENRFKLTVQYDGSAYLGWQIQSRGPTVQGELEQAVQQLTGGRRPITGAGRTDRGVHATGQVAAVTMPARWDAPSLARSLNALLPRTIWVCDVEAVDDGFHPRYDATSRSYEYRVATAPEGMSPFHRFWCWPLGRSLDIDVLEASAEQLVGSHEFQSFAKAGQEERGHDCVIHEARWEPWSSLGFSFHVTANRFLHRMVRYLVGTMVEIGLGRRPAEDLLDLLHNPNGELETSPPAPPEGLFLVAVGYGDAAARGTDLTGEAGGRAEQTDDPTEEAVGRRQATEETKTPAEAPHG